MVSPLESTLNAWKQRDAEAQQLGIDRSQYQELAKRDVKNVMSGGTAMPSSEVNIALLSGATGTPIVQTPQRGTGPKDIIGNIPKDTEDILRGFIPGTARWLWRLPQEIGHTYILGKESPGQEPLSGDLGALARNASRDPLLSMIPGVFTASRLTTSEGRKELQQRPVTTFLDVLPFVSKLGKMATAGKIAEAGSATEAFQKGHVVRGTFRGAADTLEKVPVVGKVTSRERWNKFAADMGVDQAARERLARPFSVLSRKADKEQARFMREEIMPLFEGMDEAQRVRLTDYLQQRRRGVSGGIPEFDAIGAKIDQLNERFYRYGEREGGLARIYVPGVADPVTFSTESPVYLSSKRKGRAEEALSRIEHRRGNAELVLDRWRRNLTTRTGKVRGFMEDQGQFASRAEGEVGPEVVRSAARPMVEAFQHLDPEKVFREYLDKIMDGTVRKQTAAFLMRDFRKLKGEAGYGPRPNTGLMARFDEALARGDVRAAAQQLTEINRILRHKSWDGFDTTTRIRAHVRDLREELVGLRRRTTSFGYAARMVKKAEDRLGRYQGLEDAARTKLNERTATFMKDLAENPPKSFHPVISDLIRRGAIDEARLMYTGEELARVEEKLATSPTMTELSSLIGADKFKQLWSDIHDNWMDLARQGYDPIWVHNVPTSRFENAAKPRLLPDHESRPGQWHDAVTNFGPGMADVAVGLSAASAEIISRKYTSVFIADHLMPFAESKAVLRDKLYNQLKDSGFEPKAGFGRTYEERLMGEVERIMKRDYRDFDPNRYGMKWPSMTREGLVLPVGADRALNAFTRNFQYVPIRGAYDKALRVYKYSVLAGPKQASDALFGGMLTVLLNEPKALFKMRDAYQMMKNGTLPEELSHNFYDLSTDQMFQLAAGKTMGRMFKDTLRLVPRGIERMAAFEEGVTTMYRAATYLSAAESASKKGLSHAMAEEVGLRTAYKTLVDFDGMSHLERSVLRNVFPFYSFMRYVMEFILTYPSDHPLRASILSRFADFEKKDQEGKGGDLADKWGNYFFLGKPDVNGNVTAVDYRSANPFNSAANMFTLAGFVSAVNPFVAAAAEASGINTLTATPDLYPDMVYDENTGSLTAKRPNVLLTAAGKLLPPIQGADTFLTFSNRMKRLKERNPEAYRRAMFQQLHMPFAYGNVNVPYEQAKNQMAKVRGAREELSTAMSTGDWTRVKRYNLVPYQGQLVDPARLETFWKTITAALAQQGIDASPRAVLPR